MAAERWVIYATFDSEGTASPFAEAQLEADRQVGFETLVVDTSPVLSARRIEAWDRSSSAWLRRDNTAYDFGSFRHGLQVLLDERKVQASELDLLFTNDSCSGPCAPIADVLRKLDGAPRDARRVFGMTDSDEVARHLQSHWLHFRSDVVHPAIDHMGALAPIQHRQDAVLLGEVGLSQFLLGRGCTLIPHLSTDAGVRHFAGFHGRWLSLTELALRRRAGRPRYQWVRENPNGDLFVPALPPADPRDNTCVDRWLRDTRRYPQHHGA